MDQDKKKLTQAQKGAKGCLWIIIGIIVLIVMVSSCSSGDKNKEYKSIDSNSNTTVADSGEEITHFSMQQEEISDSETVFTGKAKPGIEMNVESPTASIIEAGIKKKKAVIKCDNLGKFSVKVDSSKSEIYIFKATINKKEVTSYQSCITEKDKIKEWKETLENEKKLKMDRVNMPTILQLKKSPKKYDGHHIIYKGEILEAREEGQYTHLRIAVNGDIGNVIYVKYQGKTRAVEGNNVTVYGTVFGEMSYKSQAGWDISLPEISAEIIARK